MVRERERDSKFLRLTGLWESKKRGLFTGKLRVDDIRKLIDKCDEADKAGVQMVFFLWTNEKKTHKDPEFTLQVAVAEEQEGSRGSRSHSDRDEPSRGRERVREEPREARREAPKEEPKAERSSRRAPEEPRSSRSKPTQDERW